MSELITHTARLVPYSKRPKQVPSFVTAYVYEPLTEDAGIVLGNLYVVIEVLVSGRSSEEVADLVISTAGETYYNQASTSTEPLARFEAAVKAINHELGEYVSQGNAAWIGKLSAVIAVQVGTELHLAHTGSAEAFLYRGSASTSIGGSSTQARPTTPAKTFGSIASGQLEQGDRILLATPALVHQLSLKKLHDVVSNGTPNSALGEITELLRGGISDRIAALIIQLTTPEQAALQVRSDEPNEIQLGSPDNALEAARMIAAPIAHATIASTRRAGASAKTGWQRLRPHAHKLGIGGTELLRRFLTGPKAKLRIGIAGAVIVLFFGVLIWTSTNNGHVNALLKRYSANYQQLQSANHLLASEDRAGARTAYTRIQGDLLSIQHDSGRFALEHRLSRLALPEDEPRTVAAFSTLVAGRLDEVDGVASTTPITVAAFTEIKNSNPTRMELSSGKAYIIDSQNKSAIYVVNITTGILKPSLADTAKMGTVTATALSSANDGMYILTTKPSVWFYRFDSDTLTEQTIGLSQWPPASALASYNGNLYLLGSSAIYKHLRTITGFSPKSEYLSVSQSPALARASGLAVDGSVYASSPAGLQQYLAGSLKQTASFPSQLGSLTDLKSIAGGSFLTATSVSAKRIVYFSVSGKLTFARQVKLDGVKELYDAAYDDKTKIGFALVNGRLVRYDIKL